MKKSSGVPDAWDEDYETLADQGPSTTSQAVPEVKTTRAERKAQHAEANRQLWESAEKLETFHFVEARSNVPLKAEFKPQMKVLSRKPKSSTPTLMGKNTGTIDPEEDDSEEEARKAQQATLLERQQKAQREREEKQRKYAEVRERLFGSTGATNTESSSGRSSPSRGGRAKTVRGNRRGGADVSGRNSQSASSADHSPARPASQPMKELHDPDYNPKSRPIILQKRDANAAPEASQPIRHPRGPDGSGRGGFGFAPRGGKTNHT